MDAILYRPSDSTKGPAAEYLARRLKQITAANPKDPNDEADFWAMRERSFFTLWLSQYVVEDERFNLSEYNAIQRKALTGRRETRGRPKIYKPGYEDATYRLALRHWLLDGLIAKALSAEFKEPMPKPPMPKLKFEPEVLELMLKFELLTEYSLPQKAYVIFTREDREALYNIFYPHLKDRKWVEYSAPCIKFEEYLALRQRPEFKNTIKQALVKEIAKTTSYQLATTKQIAA